MIRVPLLALCLIALTVPAAGDEPAKPAEAPAEAAKPAAAPEPEPPGYAGEEMCAACHEAQASSYASTPHARSGSGRDGSASARACGVEA